MGKRDSILDEGDILSFKQQPELMN